MARDTRQTASIPKRGQLPTSNDLDTAVANLRCAAALLSALFEGGVRHIVVSSGSRCAPLVLAAGHHGRMRVWTHPDERSAAFCALGIAKESCVPAALICTSGTAAANYFPAIIEAKMSGTPMIVITADRPPHLRGIGASQTIDQIEIYGGYVPISDDLPISGGVQTWKVAAIRALTTAIESGAPVHLNAPFDEPLIPTPEIAAETLTSEFAIASPYHATPTMEQLSVEHAREMNGIAELIARSKRPLIVCGPQSGRDEPSSAVLNLAEQLGAPVLADVASQLRRHSAVIAHYDLILRDPQVRDQLTPDLVLRVGGLPTSKALNQWIASTPATCKIGISERLVADPDRCLTHSVRVSTKSALSALQSSNRIRPREQSEYAKQWMRLDAVTSESLRESGSDSQDVFEPSIVAQISHQCHGALNLFLSNSMPIRWADMYAGAHADFPRVFVNRGANGIDGITSTAAGVARASGRTTICILGDLTFLHDQNGLWRLREEEIPLKLVVLNNDGGGVFHFLPISSHSEHFEHLVAMPHGIDISRIAAAHGIPHHLAESSTHFTALFRDCLNCLGPEIIEVRTNRGANFKRHQEVIRKVSLAVRNALGIA